MIAKTRLYEQGGGRTLTLSIPSKMADDSAFPFHVHDEVSLRVEDGRLIIEKEAKQP